MDSEAEEHPGEEAVMILIPADSKDHMNQHKDHMMPHQLSDQETTIMLELKAPLAVIIALVVVMMDIEAVPALIAMVQAIVMDHMAAEDPIVEELQEVMNLQAVMIEVIPLHLLIREDINHLSG